MTKEELVQQLREAADLVEKGNEAASLEETIKKMVQDVPPIAERVNAYDIVKMIATNGGAPSKDGVEDAYFDFNFEDNKSPDVDRYVDKVLESCNRYTPRDAVGLFIDSIIEHGGKQALENCLHDMGWAKRPDDGVRPFKDVADGINSIPSMESRTAACKDLLSTLIDEAPECMDRALNAGGYYNVDCDGFEKRAKEWAEDNGWAKIGEDVPIRAVVSALETMPPESLKKTCYDLVDQLIESCVPVNCVFFDALAEHDVYEKSTDQFEEAAQQWAEQHDYIHKDSDEFEDLAKEWAEDNDWVNTNDYSFEDLVDKYDRNTVRDFVVEYIEENL